MIYDYKRLSPFKWFILENFPLIDEDFDALTNWQLFCKLGKEINKLINSQNATGEQIENLTNAFNALKDYVDNYFANLDVQDEINAKLDAMAESGDLEAIIASYLNTNAILAFDTVTALKGATNLANGTFVRTFGKSTYNDGLGSLYKIRALTNNDVVDEKNLVSLTNFNTLVAEKIYVRNPFTNKKYLFVGDSLAWGYQGANVDPITGFFELVTDKFNLNSTIVCYPGYGFEGASSGYTWQNLIEARNLKNKEEYTDIIIMGGDNDSPNASIFTSITTTINYLKSNFKNATIHLGCIGRKSDYDNVAQCQNRRIINKIYQNSAYKNGIKYIDGSWLILHHKSYYISDKTHLNANGENQVAYCLGQYILNGRIDDFLDINDPTTDYKTDTMAWDENVTPFSGFTMYSYIDKNNTYWRLAGGINFVENPSVGYNTDMVIGQLTNSYVTSSIYNQGLNSTFRVVLLTADNTYKACSVNIYNDYQNKIHLKFFTFLDSGNFNNVAIQKIFFDSYAFTMIADSKYC